MTDWKKLEPGVYQCEQYQIRREWRRLGGMSWRVFGPGLSPSGHRVNSLSDGKQFVARKVKT